MSTLFRNSKSKESRRSPYSQGGAFEFLLFRFNSMFLSNGPRSTATATDTGGAIGNAGGSIIARSGLAGTGSRVAKWAILNVYNYWPELIKNLLKV